jgi:prephenate dehydrogenase
MAAIAVGPAAIIGLGAVGGSVARALLRAGSPVRGFASSGDDVAAARRAGLDVASSVAECVAEASVVLIAVPLAAHAEVAEAAVSAASDGATLLHAASLQAERAVGRTRRVIGTHPLAGTHRAGFDASHTDMFAACVVSVEARAPSDVRAVAERLWRAVGAARFEYRSAEDHDRLMAWVSHLPQLASTALAGAIGSAGVGCGALGPGGRDAVRLAASSFEMWGPILSAARPEAARAAAALERSVGALRSALETGDMQAIESLWTTARTWAGSQ